MSGSALSPYSGASALQANTGSISPQLPYTNNNDTASNLSSYSDASNVDTTAYINAENTTNVQESISPTYPDLGSDSSSLRNSNSANTKARPSSQASPLTTDGKKGEPDKEKESGYGKMLVKEERMQPPPHMLEPPGNTGLAHHHSSALFSCTCALLIYIWWNLFGL